MSRSLAEPAANAVTVPARRWVACGDSFTAGIEPGESWADLVVADAVSGSGLELTNLAAVGATVAEVERDQLPRAIGARPDLVTLICGGNDVIGTVRPRLAELAGDLDRAFARLATALPGAVLLTATYPPIAAGAMRPRTQRRIEHGMARLNELIAAAAERHRFGCVALERHPGSVDRDNYGSDGIHPSPEGRRVAADVLGPAIAARIADELERSM